MTKLEQLIEELCPNGVEYRKLSEVTTIERGRRVVKEQLSHDSGYPVFQNSLPPMGFHTDSNYPAETSYVIGAGAAGEIGYCKEDFWAADDCFPIVCGDSVINRYVYHFLLWQQPVLLSKVRKASIPRLSRSVIENIMIPVPPLPVQSEIVRILDKFTELTAELTARKKQYEYYTEQLMNFGDNVKMLTLGEIGSVKMCKRILKSQTNTEGGIPFYKIGTFGREPDAFISEEVFEEYKEKYSYPKKGDILISCSGTIGRTVVFDGEPAYFQDSNIVWLEHDEKIVTNKYLQYSYKKQPWQISTGGTIARLYNDNILKARIPVPPIEEQERIVAILDRFDTLCNDISAGLPAEIEARQKQYEYYRDKLLTFKEVKA